MQNNFLEYIQKNGPEAFDKMAADLAKQINEAKAQYEADQKKKQEDARTTMVQQIGALLKSYYGDKLPMDPTKLGEAVLAAVDDAVTEAERIKKLTEKMEVVKDEDVPGGHVKVVRGNLSDLSDEELADFWNNVHETFFKV